MSYDLAQTFYLDADAVQSAKLVYATSVDLYFYSKPVENQTSSGIAKPGVTVYLCGTNSDNSPDLESITRRFVARVEYDNINVSTVGDAVTTFNFSQPVYLPTNRQYAVVIKFDGSDKGFLVWYNKAGENMFGTDNITQVSSGKVDGSLFTITNGLQLTPQTDADLSFNISVAKFSTTPTTYKFVNRSYEILQMTTISSRFYGGEKLYEKRANNTGTVVISATSTTLTGTGTSFSSSLQVGDNFVITDGTVGNTNVRTVVSVANSTSMNIDVQPSFSNASGAYYRTVTGDMYIASGQSDYLVIQDSTANSTIYLSPGSQIYGVDSGVTANVVTIETFGVNGVFPGLNVMTPSFTNANVTLNFANSGYGVSSTNEATFEIGKQATIDTYPAIVASRTTEVTSGIPFKSVTGTLTMSTSNPYTSPIVREENLDMFLETFAINNDDTNEYLGIGNASSKYISKPVSLAKDQIAEDAKVYIRAYRPTNTDIKVYLKLKNSYDIESLDVKQWSELTPTPVTEALTSTLNAKNYLELEYGLPFEPTGVSVSGSFTTTSSNAVIIGSSGSVNTSLTTGDVVHLYSPSTPNTYFVDTVTTSNTTTFTISSAVANTSLVGSGFLVNKVTRVQSAFLDVQQQNLATYFNSSLSRFRGYDTFAVKIVLLSSDGFSVPYVDDVRVVAVSA